jgi:4,5-DOPA dioxygenase extradiol
MMTNAQTHRGLPTLFVPHGAPTFALQPGAAGAALHAFAQRIGQPKAVLIVSAHWDTQIPTLSVDPKPETIHDFYGFPRPLYAIRYPATGAVSLGMDARALLEDAGFEVALDPQRGLDHGAWIPLGLMFPEANVPVLALSLQSHQGPEYHYRIGEALSSLREQGVLVIGSGNLTHNLGHFHQLQGAHGAPAYVTQFQGWVRDRLLAQDIDQLLAYRTLAPGAIQAHPTDEHLLPFYVALGAAGRNFVTEAVYSGVEYNMLAMDSYAFWPTPSSF